MTHPNHDRAVQDLKTALLEVMGEMGLEAKHVLDVPRNGMSYDPVREPLALIVEALLSEEPDHHAVHEAAITLFMEELEWEG